MSQVKDDSPVSTSLKHRLRDIFSPKAKATSSLPSANSNHVSPPSRIPIRKKRSFRDVAEEDPDNSSNPRARTRQRVDSTSSVITVRGSRGVSRKASTDSVKTICEPKRTLKRTPSSISLSLDPGQAAPARAVLTRNTSHNQIQAPSSPVQDKRSILPFPAKRMVSLKAPPRASASDYKATRASLDVASSSSSRPESHLLKRSRSSRSLSTAYLEGAPDKKRALSSIADAPSVSTSQSPLPAPSPSEPPAPLSPEEEMLRQVLEYVVNEPDDEDADASEFNALLSRSPSTFTELSSSPESPSSLAVPDALLPEIPDDDSDDESAPGLRYDNQRLGDRVFYPPPPRPSRSHLDRFDVRVKPYNTHIALWDMKPDDIYAWPAVLYLTDHQAEYPNFDRPPVRNIDVEFHSTEDTPTVSVQPTSPDYHVHYQGTCVAPDTPPSLLGLSQDSGIAIESRWMLRPSDAPSASSYATRVFVPIPASLFKGRECRFFKLKAKVTFTTGAVAHSGTVRVSVEHLRKEVHMDGRRASLDV
ncbi:hypothetical protein EUX98_g3929 [Antrodiella citrinella]|uniref:Uncharacterized protein n=1 Tax=Antrodiella citrinella TaxID=2447956 RepID=A0A4S4MVC1_9APHY|nr:hypothetical protein EUX98_g3929 [Antrodiella citrinella]